MRIEEIEQEFEKLGAGFLEEGLALIQKRIDNRQTTDDERFAISQYFYKYGFLTEAIQLSSALHKQYPDEIELSLFLAELLMEAEKEEEALALLEQINPEDEEDELQVLLLTAEVYLLQGLPEVAEYKLTEALDTYSAEPVLYNALAEVYYQQEKYQQAVLCFEKGNITYSYAKMADCYAHLGRFEEALGYYRKATEDVYEPQVLWGYGLVAYQLQDWELAAQKFSQLVQMDPFYTSAYPMLVEAYKQLGELKEAYQFAVRGLSYDQTNPQLFFEKGVLLEGMQGDIDEAENHYRQALALDDHHLPSLEKLYQSAFRREDWQQALLYLNRWLEIEPERAELYRRLGQIYSELEEWSQAENYLREAIALDSEDVESLNALAYLLRDEGQLDEALTLWQKSLKINGDQWEIEELLDSYE